MKNKNAVYTVVTGCYDSVFRHKYICREWDYICFSDAKIDVPSPWRLVLMERSKLDNGRKSRLIKLLPHKFLSQYETSVYIDANIDVLDDKLEHVVRRHIDFNSSMALAPHPLRDCLFDEAAACMRLSKGNKKKIIKQIKEYHKFHMPLHYGLYCGGIIFRRHNESCISKAMEMWWQELKKHSGRDQISLPYVLYRQKIHVEDLFFDRYENFINNTSSFKINRHNKKLSLRILKCVISLVPIKQWRRRLRRQYCD